MRAPTNPNLLEAFLIVGQPRQRLGHWQRALAVLDSPLAPPLAAIHAYYDATADEALIELRYDELALGDTKLKFVVDVALLAEVGMVQPAELSEGECVRFLADRLARCKLQATYQRSVCGALVELVRLIKEQRTMKTHAVPPPIPRPGASQTPARARTVQGVIGPRGDTDDPVLLVSAKGTRDDLFAEAEAARREITRHTVSRAQRLPTVEIEPHRAALLETRARVGDGDPTAPLPPIGATPYLPASDVPPTGGTIHARYLRGGRWVPIRVGALSLRGAALMTGALPRLNDRVDVAFNYLGHRALVRGAVHKISSMREAAETGATTFSIKFELDEPAREQLVALLRAAREAKVTIKPPPMRHARRFPVEWPITLGTLRGPAKTDALDLSNGGMFVRTDLPLEIGTILGFSASLDDGGGPVAGSARVVRHVPSELADTCGVAAGYGLELCDLVEADKLRWLAFLARIERRADKRVLIGASPKRFAELQAGLAGCGYAVTGGTDPGALVQLARADDRSVDVAVLDGGWLANGSSLEWLERLFSARDVPCVTLQGDVRRARQAIDKLLEVVV